MGVNQYEQETILAINILEAEIRILRGLRDSVEDDYLYSEINRKVIGITDAIIIIRNYCKPIADGEE